MLSFRRAISNSLRPLENTDLLCFVSVVFPCCLHTIIRYDIVLYLIVSV